MTPLRAWATLALTLVLSLAGAAAGRAAEPSSALVESLRARGVLSTTEAKAVDAAVVLNPHILDAAAEKAGAAADPAANASAGQLKGLKEDLLARAQLQAVASGMIQVQPEEAKRLAPAMALTGSPGLGRIVISKHIGDQAIDALSTGLKIIKPICADGAPPKGGADLCLKGDPWSEALFRSVAPILVDQRQVCTGSALGGGLILTAAHCVLEAGGPDGVRMVDPKRITVVNLAGQAVGLAKAPDVPTQMRAACLPDCPDMDYDFAVLRIPAAQSDFQPLPLLKRLAAPGALAITMAGYGVTNMPAGASKTGLYIGAQNLTVTSLDKPLEWTYRYQDTPGSTFCSRDSGGPIFWGNPRKAGDGLEQIGVISKFVPQNGGDCFIATATAVNLGQSGPRQTLCGFLANVDPFCR